LKQEDTRSLAEYYVTVVSDYFFSIINMLQAQFKDVTEKAKFFIKNNVEKFGNNIDRAITYFKIKILKKDEYIKDEDLYRSF